MLFSILIVNYNYGIYLEHAIKSCLNQDFEDYEILIYDDGSTDNSIDIIKSFEGRIKYYLGKKNPQSANISQFVAFDFLAKRAQGQYLCLLDSDDYFHHEKLKNIKKIITLNPDKNVIQHPFWQVNNQKQTRIVRPFLRKSINRKSFINARIPLYFACQTSGIIVKKENLANLNFNAVYESGIWLDVIITRNAILDNDIITHPRPLGFYRVHDTNDSHRLKNWNKRLAALIEQLKYVCQLAEEKSLKSRNWNILVYLLERNSFLSRIIMIFTIPYGGRIKHKITNILGLN